MSNPKAQLDVVNSRSVFEAYLIGRVMIFFFAIRASTHLLFTLECYFVA